MMPATQYMVTAPGRLCLFGEHQDYLGLPVITLAVSRFISVFVHPRDSKEVQISFRDLGGSRTIPLDQYPVPYEGSRDYIASCINVLRANGFALEQGLEAQISGTIPINAGMSSSSALVIAWLGALAFREGHEIDPEEIARLGYEAEVAEFGEAGGMMDHFAAAVGGLIHLETSPAFVPHPLEVPALPLVVGNSKEKKSTVDDLRRVKERALRGFQELREAVPDFDVRVTPLAAVRQYLPSLSVKTRPNVEGNLENRDLLRAALAEFKQESVDCPKIGRLLSDHHAILRDKIGISTPKIDRMLAAVIHAGAWGGKINGSGFGGTMFVLAPPKNVPAVIAAIQAEDADAFEVEPVSGIQCVVKELS